MASKIHVSAILMAKSYLTWNCHSKCFTLLNFVYTCKTLILKNWRSTIFSPLIVSVYTRWQPIDDKNHIIYQELAFDIFMLKIFASSILYDCYNFANTLFHIFYLSKMADKMAALTKKCKKLFLSHMY